jgi:hypothetical protein
VDILDHAPNRVSTLAELAALYGENVWLVAPHSSVDNINGEPNIINFSDAPVKQWKIGGFAKYNSGGGLKPFWPRFSIGYREEVFLLDWNYRSLDIGPALRIRSYNIPTTEEKFKYDRSSDNFAIFKSEHDADVYRVALSLSLDSQPKKPQFVFHQDVQKIEEKIFHFSHFQTRFFSSPEWNVSQQRKQNVKSIPRALQRETSAL